MFSKDFSGFVLINGISGNWLSGPRDPQFPSFRKADFSGLGEPLRLLVYPTMANTIGRQVLYRLQDRGVLPLLDWGSYRIVGSNRAI
jgi:hypothetical protein